MAGEEGDSMTCRACSRDGRASEGYPCATCGTFVCVRCTLRGVTQCATCAKRGTAPGATA